MDLRGNERNRARVCEPRKTQIECAACPDAEATARAPGPIADVNQSGNLQIQSLESRTRDPPAFPRDEEAGLEPKRLAGTVGDAEASR